MEEYSFFAEFTGGRSVATTYTEPTERVTAIQIKAAIDKFCRKHGLKCDSYEELPEGGYRAYLYKKALFKKNKELIFYIRQESGQGAVQ